MWSGIGLRGRQPIDAASRNNDLTVYSAHSQMGRGCTVIKGLFSPMCGSMCSSSAVVTLGK